MNNEKILLNYLHQTTYNNTPLNQIGTDADFLSLYPDETPLRTVPTPTGDIAYVRKFGVVLEATACTHLEDPVDANCTFKCYALDGTLLGSRTGGGAFTAGSTVGSAQQIYLKIEASGGAVTLNTFGPVYSATIGGVGYTFIIAAETIADGSSLILYLSTTDSTYYDVNLKYGGARHTPALNDSDKPYFTIASAYAVLAAANNDAVEILDSETYDEDLTTDNQALDSSDTIVYATAGETPTITRGIGARITREVSQQYNNITAIYFNENGDDANPGTWQEPKLNLSSAITASTAAAIATVYGGNGATITGGIFNDGGSVNAERTVESDYGYMPTLKPGSETTTLTFLNTNAAICSGFIIRDAQYGIKCNTSILNELLGNFSLLDNTFINNWEDGFNLTSTSDGKTIIVERNYFYNNRQSAYIRVMVEVVSTSTIYFRKNFMINNSLGLYLRYDSAEANTVNYYINDNIFNGTTKDSGYYGFEIAFVIDYPITVNGSLNNNTVNNAGRGWWLESASASEITFGCTFDNNITNNIGQYCIYENITNLTNKTINYWTFYDYGTDKMNAGATITIANEISGDPEFIDISNYNFSLKIISPCYRASAISENTGASIRIIEIDASDIVINGIKIDGQDFYDYLIFIRDTSNHIRTIIKWCSIYSGQGIGIELYDDDTDLDSIISNNIFKNNGYGVVLTQGNNIIEENVFSNNIVYNLYIDYITHLINHNVFYGSQYGIYIDSNSSAITITNNIFNNNSLYGIYSEIGIVILYNCITDSLNTNLDNSSDTNINNNPLFINTESGTENFNIKTIEAGYTYNSACKDSSDDGYDIGAYMIDRSIVSDSWKKHQFTYNPRIVSFDITPKGLVTFDSGNGTNWHWAKSFKRGYDLQWQTGQYSDETDRLKVEFLNTLIQNSVTDYSNEEVKIRFNPLLTELIESGTAATVSALTITDSGKSWVENELKGFHVAQVYDSDTANGTITAATKKLQVAPSPTWTDDEWIGYYFFYNGYFYYITDNDADELTLSDPDDTLSNVSNINWTIEKYFKITSNTATALTVTDDDSELVAGSYDYKVRFIECHIINPRMSYKQPRYYWQKETWKTGYTLSLEEI